MNKISKTDLIAKVASETGFTKKDVAVFFEALRKVLLDYLKQSFSVCMGFFTVIVKNKKPRIGRNPRTGQEIQIAAKTAVSVKVSKSLQSQLSE